MIVVSRVNMADRKALATRGNVGLVLATNSDDFSVSSLSTYQWDWFSFQYPSDSNSDVRWWIDGWESDYHISNIANQYLWIQNGEYDITINTTLRSCESYRMPLVPWGLYLTSEYKINNFLIYKWNLSQYVEWIDSWFFCFDNKGQSNLITFFSFNMDIKQVIWDSLNLY